MIIPFDVTFIISSLEYAGFQAFVVGGCVRDYILSSNAKDWDITTNALPHHIKSIFSHTIDIGIEHGTVAVIINNNSYEVTTYRIDGEYIDNRHPENVTFTSNINDDLSRRDFTMNSIAFNPNVGYVDPFGGINDINSRTIKAVGDPHKRFNEDALRMMRAIRFANQLDFEIEKYTFYAIIKNKSLISNISVERIREEFLKIIYSDYIHNFFLLKKSGLIDYFLPEFDYIFQNINKNISILKLLQKDLRLYFLLSFLDEKSTEIILKRLKFDNKTISEAKTICRFFNIDFVDDRLLTIEKMSFIHPEILKKIVTIKFVIFKVEKNLIMCKTFENIFDQINDVLNKNYCYTLKQLKINGNDLKGIGVTDGKKIGDTLKFCLSNVLKNQKLNSKETLIFISKKYNNII